MTKTYTCDVIEADDGSGDAIIQFTDEFIAHTGWKAGTVLNIETRVTPTGNVIVLTEKK